MPRFLNNDKYFRSSKKKSAWIQQTKREIFIERIFAALSVLGEGWDLGSPILSYKQHPRDEMQGFPSYSIVQLALRYATSTNSWVHLRTETRSQSSLQRGLMSLCRSLLWDMMYSQSSTASPRLYSPAACFSFFSSASLFSHVGIKSNTCEDPGTAIIVNNNHQLSSERARDRDFWLLLPWSPGCSASRL